MQNLSNTNHQVNSTNFRVFPYQQLTAEGDIWLSWLAESALNAQLIVTDHLGAETIYPSIQPVYKNILSYTKAETQEEIPGLVQGSWLKESSNYKYSVRISGLLPGKSYDYKVVLGGEVYASTIRTAPSQEEWESVRFAVLSDSETEPRGRINYREWSPGSYGEGSLMRPDINDSPWQNIFGVHGQGGEKTLRYMLSETDGYRSNLEILNKRVPDFMLMPGDLVQGGGYQPGWDEFFLHNAGKYAQGLSSYPILPAFGNWDNFGALNGGYGTDAEGRFGPEFSREKFLTYFDAPKKIGMVDGSQSYYRIDYGPLTILTLDSSNGIPEQKRQDTAPEEKLLGQQFLEPGTDTQENFQLFQFPTNSRTVPPDFNPGSEQWYWTVQMLDEAKQAGKLIFVQFHHAPYSSGAHGFPMNHIFSSGQGGTPMQKYHPIFEEYGVIAVFSGHGELFERSFVDKDGDGKGVHYYDVGVAGDGLRGEIRESPGFDAPLLRYNPHRAWTADQDEGEVWELNDGVLQLQSGGKHYGHLEVNVEKLIEENAEYAKVTFSPVYSFPVLDKQYKWIKSERRVYEDEIELKIKIRDIQPEISGPILRKDIKLYLDVEGKSTLQIKDLFAENPEDLLEDYTFTMSKSTFNCLDLDADFQNIKVTTTYSGINISEENVVVYVFDTLSPQFTVKDIFINVSLDGESVIISPEELVLHFEDNCGLEEIALSKNAFTCSDVGQEKVLVTLYDKSGNSMQREAVVTVKLEKDTIQVKGNVFEAPIGTYDYQWYHNGELLDGGIGRELVVNQAGQYHVVLTSESGCSIALDPILILLTAIEGHSEPSNLVLQIFPNPARNQFTIKLSENIFENRRFVRFYNASGMELPWVPQAVHDLEFSLQYQLDKVAPGLYFVVVQTNDQELHYKKITVF